MKRLALLVVAVGALAIGVPGAQAAPTSDTGCTVEHLSGAACQGPDVRPALNSCEIATWVGDASCDLTVADGMADTTIGLLKVFAALEGTDWQTEFHMVIRDKTHRRGPLLAGWHRDDAGLRSPRATGARAGLVGPAGGARGQ